MIVSALVTIIVLTILIFYAFKYLAVLRIDELKAGLSAIAKGDLNKKIQVNYNDEIGELTESFNFMVSQLNQTRLDKLEAENNTEKMKILRDKAQQASETKSTFLRNMSHELRTPLTAIIGYCDLIRDDLKTDGRSNLVSDLDKIQSNGYNLLELISGILEISKNESGGLELNVETFDLNALVQ